MSRIPGLLLLLILASTITANAWSEDKRASREREALRRAQQQVQQLRQEKTALEQKLTGFEQEKSLLAQDREKLASEVNSAQSRARSESAKRRQLQLALDKMTREKQALQTRTTELGQRLAELTATQTSTKSELAQSQVQKKQTESMLQTRERQVASCEDKNIKLYQYGRDLITQCRDRSATDAVLRLEPFTGIKRVQIENLLEEYRDKLDAQKTLPAGSAPKPPPAAE